MPRTPPRAPNNSMKKIFPFVLAALLAAFPAFTEAASISAKVDAHIDGTSVSASSTIRAQDKTSTEQTRGDAEIAERITSLTALTARVSQMVHLTADEKTQINATIQGDINTLTTLKASIDTDTASSTLAADLQSITKGERIYLLVEPQVLILATADRAESIGAMFTTLSSKISARLSTSPNSSASALLTDLNAKVADSNVQASAALSETASLTPDNGTASIQASNTAALKDARTRIQAAQKDLRAAQQDALQIVKLLMSAKASASATTTVE